jgi:hypothetical protein
MFWSRRFAILASLIRARLIAGGFYLLGGISAPHRMPPAQTGDRTTPIIH